MSRGKLILRSKKDQAVRRFHPWIFSNAIKSQSGEVNDGEIVEVYSNKEKFLGCGHYQQEGSISIRMLSFFNEEWNEDIIATRIQRAYQTRIKANLLREDNNCFRLIFAEGDRLPGLIADYYAGFVVMQCHSSGMYYMRQNLADEIMKLEGVKGVYCKFASSLTKMYEDVDEPSLLAGEEFPEDLVAVENGIQFMIDWKYGQKTGFFIDQRDNRKLLGELSKGKKVLNTFCYTGGFSLYALKHEAELVHSLDSSQPALDIIDKSLELNKISSSNHKNICADAVQYIKELEVDYDMIILDPPAFAKSRHARHNAVQGYKRLNAAAMRQIKSGGIIATFSCSQVVDADLFYNTIVAAALSVEREVKVLSKLSQPADHPIGMFHPEGAYLKGLILEVI